MWAVKCNTCRYIDICWKILKQKELKFVLLNPIFHCNKQYNSKKLNVDLKYILEDLERKAEEIVQTL